MKCHLAAIAFTCFAMTGASMAGELAPGSGRSVQLGGIQGVVYYTADQDGYKVVTTLAAGSEGLPIRFSSTLSPGQRTVISVPRAAGEPTIDFEIVRDGNVLRVSEPVAVAPTQVPHGRIALAE